MILDRVNRGEENSVFKIIQNLSLLSELKRCNISNSKKNGTLFKQDTQFFNRTGLYLVMVLLKALSEIWNWNIELKTPPWEHQFVTQVSTASQATPFRKSTTLSHKSKLYFLTKRDQTIVLATLRVAALLCTEHKLVTRPHILSPKEKKKGENRRLSW